MDDRSNTIAGWVLGGGIAALGFTIASGMFFHAEVPEAGKQGYAIQGVEVGGETGVAAPEQNRQAAVEVGGDGAKGFFQLLDRQIVDSLVDVVLQALAFQHAGGVAEKRYRPVADAGLVHVERHPVQGEAVVAGRVQCPDQAAGAGANHEVSDDTLRFERLDDADVGKTASSAAAERETDAQRSRHLRR